mgnify:CR=1 FL=1
MITKWEIFFGVILIGFSIVVAAYSILFGKPEVITKDNLPARYITDQEEN